MNRNALVIGIGEIVSNLFLFPLQSGGECSFKAARRPPRVASGALIYRNEPHTAIDALIDGCGL